jgi:hypothetical protein
MLKIATVIVKGGLGNQLFQLAFADFLRRNNIFVNLDVSYFANDPYNRSCHVKELFPEATFDTQPPKTKLVEGENVRWGGPKGELLEIHSAPNLTEAIFDGYWQDLRYVSRSFVEEVRLRISSVIPKEISQLGESLRSKIVLGIHIRRHDYKHHGIASFDYIVNSTKWMIQNHPEISEVKIFSDEPNSSKFILDQHINQPHLIQTGADLADFFLLSSCSHFVISNSTFSLWACLVSNSQNVLYPSPWSLISEPSPFLIPKAWKEIKGSIEPIFYGTPFDIPQAENSPQQDIKFRSIG